MEDNDTIQLMTIVDWPVLNCHHMDSDAIQYFEVIFRMKGEKLVEVDLQASED